MKERVKNIAIILIGIISITSLTVSAATLINSKEVVYDNTASGLRSTTVQGAVDELYSAATDYSTLNNKVDSLKTEIINTIYPKGSIYTSVEDDTVEKVEARFGGTWERYAEGRTLVGVGTGTDSNGTVKVFNKNETLGEYNNILTVSEMPSHTHKEAFPIEGIVTAGWDRVAPNVVEDSLKNNVAKVQLDYTSFDMGIYYPITTFAKGDSMSHNNIQPYITVYMYKRVS